MEQYNKDNKSTQATNNKSGNMKKSGYSNTMSEQLTSKAGQKSQSDSIDGAAKSLDSEKRDSDSIFGLKEFDQALDTIKESVSTVTRFVRERPVLVIGSAFAVGAAAALVIAFNRRRHSMSDRKEV